MTKSCLKALIIIAALVIMSTAVFAETITFWVMPNPPENLHVPWLDQNTAAFEKETGITVKYEIVGWGDAWPRLTAALATGEGVDVSQAGTTWNPQFGATGGLAELNSSEFGGKQAFMKGTYISTLYKFKEYGIPWFAETRALFVNTKMFADAGVKYPTTQDELIQVGKKIVAKFGEGTAIALAGTNAWDLLHNWSIILYSRGGRLVSKDYKAQAFYSRAGIDAMNWYVSLFKEGLASKACAEYNQPQADSAFASGSVAMCYMGPWNIPQIADQNPDLAYDIVEPPAGPTGIKAAFAGGSNLVVYKAGKVEAAKAWVKYLIRDDVLLSYCKICNMLPSKISVFADTFFSAPKFQLFKKVLAYATAYPPLGVWGDIENAVQNEFKNVVSDFATGKFNEDPDNGTVATYLKRAAKRVNAALAKEWTE